MFKVTFDPIIFSKSLNLVKYKPYRLANVPKNLNL